MPSRAGRWANPGTAPGVHRLLAAIGAGRAVAERVSRRSRHSRVMGGRYRHPRHIRGTGHARRSRRLRSAADCPCRARGRARAAACRGGGDQPQAHRAGRRSSRMMARANSSPWISWPMRAAARPWPPHRASPWASARWRCSATGMGRAFPPMPPWPPGSTAGSGACRCLMAVTMRRPSSLLAMCMRMRTGRWNNATAPFWPPRPGGRPLGRHASGCRPRRGRDTLSRR